VRTLEGPEGRPAALFGINLDITPLKRAEAAVLEGERRIETLIGNLTGMVYRCRNEHGWPMEFVSRGALPLTGWEPEAFLRSEVRYEDLIHPEDREHVWREVQSAVQRRSDFLLYYRIVTRSGQTRYVVEQGLAGESGAADGKAAALEGYIMDITARKELEAALDESEAQLRFVSDHAPVFIAHYDTDKRYKFVNQPYADLYGLPATALIGRRVGEVLDDATREIIEPHMDRALAGQLISFDYTPETATGGRRTFNVKYVPERNPDGAVVGFVAAISDISARVQAETELRQARDQLEERVKERTAELMAARNRAEVADRMKSLFLATMSHELRTPLNAISGFSSTLLKELPGPLNQEQRQQMRFIRQGADHLLALINDILDISKIEAGHIELKPQTFDLADHLRGWAHSLRNKMEQLGLALRLDFPPGPVEVTSDPRRLRQIVLNLLTNAMKFTHEGHIEVALVVPPSPPGTNPDGPVSIRVTDTGGGIAPADQERIFEPFVQGHTAPASNRRRGTGLGLSISRQLAERMGGTLTLERTGDQGTTFLLQLPRHLGEDPVRTHPHQS
jgi:PAS domain S-box-containing protein